MKLQPIITINLTPFSCSKPHKGVRSKTGYLGVRIMCPVKVTCLPVYYIVQSRVYIHNMICPINMHLICLWSLKGHQTSSLNTHFRF